MNDFLSITIFSNSFNSPLEIGAPPGVVAASHDKFPNPSVFNTCPLLPTPFGNVNVIFDVITSGAFKIA